ncbi:MAG: alpha/beta hydrolase-fold protein [Ferruginibacter sp.]
MKTISLSLAFLLFSITCLAQQKMKVVKEFIIGSVYTIQSKVLNEERTLNIYLPQNYNANDSLKYPVIYLLDGSADEDFIHIVGLVQFNSFEWVNLLPHSIVVGIGNVDRKRDFTFPSTVEAEKKAFPTSGHADQFIQFIEKELQPCINANFKTNHSKTIIAESLGGLLATQILLTKSNLFNRYIIISPSLWWNNGSLLRQDIQSAGIAANKPIDVYIGVGKEGLAPGKTERVMEVDANILADKLKTIKNAQLRVLFDYLPAETHATIMHQAVANAFKMMAIY